jgi:dCMP deaminase
MNKWDRYFLKRAKLNASMSKDLSTSVGAVIADPFHRSVSDGFNGLPRGVDDDHPRIQHRPTKLAMTIHAEENALLFAARSVEGCRCYVWPMPPCSNCAAKLIQAGIKHVISLSPCAELVHRWGDSFRLAEDMYHEAGVELVLYSEDMSVRTVSVAHTY